MKALAARLNAHGSPLQIEEIDLPEPKDEEVVVDLVWGSVNPVDRYGALGLAAGDGPVPRTLGTEASGVSEKTDVIIHGAGVGTQRDGVWATAAVVPRAALTRVPDGVPLDQAAACGIAGATAWRVVNQVEVGSSDKVLVFGASGGVGSLIVSYAHSLGATVFGQTEKESNRQWILAQGADGVLVTGADSLADKVGDLELTVVFDCLGGGYTGEAIKVLTNYGRLSIFGTSAGTTGEIPIQMLYRKSLTVHGYGGLIASHESLAEAKAGALEAVQAATMRVEIGATVPLSEVNTAFELLVSREVSGKILLDLTQGAS
ncbi:MAG: zinc-binding alcohol dehydrogenase family protein [Acidimicrobiales bacterium]